MPGDWRISVRLRDTQGRKLKGVAGRRVYIVDGALRRAECDILLLRTVRSLRDDFLLDLHASETVARPPFGSTVKIKS